MKYFRVKQSKDNVRIFKTVGGHRYPVLTLIGNELYTTTEMRKNFGFLTKDLIDIYFEEVNISKSKVYWSFGARFEDNDEKWFINRKRRESD